MSPSEVDMLTTSIQNLRDDLAAMEGRLSERISEIHPRCQAQETRISKLETMTAEWRGAAKLGSILIPFAAAFVGGIIQATGRWIIGK